MVRKLVVALSLVGVSLLALGAYARSRLDPESLGREVLRRINQVDGVTLEAESFRLGVLRGLTLENARASVRLESGVLALELDGLLLAHRLWPLLRGELVVDRVFLERPRLELVSGRSPQLQERAARRQERRARRRRDQNAEPDRGDEAGLGALVVSVTSVRINDGALVIRERGVEDPDLRVEGLDLELHDLRIDPSSGFAELAARGRFAAAVVELGDVVATDLSGEVSLSGGIVEFGEVTFATDSGRLEVVEMVADLNQDPFAYRLSISGGIDLNRFVEAASGPQFGPAQVQMQATGLGPALDRLVGEGVVELTGGLIPAPPMIRQIEALVGRDILSGRQYEATDIHFQIADNELRIEPFELVSAEVRLTTSGRIDLAGPLDLLMQVRVPRQGLDVGGVLDAVLDSLTDRDGWVRLDFEVAGSAAEPRVLLDLDHLEGLAIEEAKEELEREAKRLGRKLLDRLFD